MCMGCGTTFLQSREETSTSDTLPLTLLLSLWILWLVVLRNHNAHRSDTRPLTMQIATLIAGPIILIAVIWSAFAFHKWLSRRAMALSPQMTGLAVIIYVIAALSISITTYIRWVFFIAGRLAPLSYLIEGHISITHYHSRATRCSDAALLRQ